MTSELLVAGGDASRSMACSPMLVIVPSGAFEMGAGSDDKFATDTERPAHRVTFRHPFAIGCTPVTIGEYRAFNPNCEDDGPDDWPVVNVSWLEATRYCGWLSERHDRLFRLPSEAEWEFACRAGTSSPFHTGSDLTSTHANFLYSEVGRRIGRGQRTPVGAYAANAFGVHDMHGNICEWVEDTWHATYLGAPADGGAWEGAALPQENRQRVIRGGAWDHMPRLLRSAWRDRLGADERRDNVGFRVAATLED